MTKRMEVSIYDAYGNRKYLTQSECKNFIRAARRARPEVFSLCMVLALTGLRISEALSLTRKSVDVGAACIIVRCAKKRKKEIYRAVPIPLDLLNILNEIHYGGKIEANCVSMDQSLWCWCRTTAWSHVRKVMNDAGLSGVRAMPKGLRHTFGVTAIQAGVPLNILQKWMGHSDMATTSIYANAIGPEERTLANLFWHFLDIQQE